MHLLALRSFARHPCPFGWVAATVQRSAANQGE